MTYLQVSDPYGVGGTGGIFQRLDRAVLNQMSNNDDAVFSRYAIWASTIKNNIVEAIQLIDGDMDEEAKIHLIRAPNGLSAFSDIQAYFDPFELEKLS